VLLGLFKDASGSSDYVASNGRVTENITLEIMWKEAVVT
jgi:hypothetical protein